MKERPILFSAPMVRAILAGDKTQTRRMVKDLSPWEITEIVLDAGGTGAWLPNGPAPSGRGMAAGPWRPCPYGQVGDRLWVRETWGYNPDHPGMAWHACYRADPGHEHDGIKWKPSIHMPRAACRILLEITGVRVERLQDISEADAIAEGCRAVPGAQWQSFEEARAGLPMHDHKAVDAFEALWEDLNGDDSWAANPWVWVVEFKRIKV